MLISEKRENKLLTKASSRHLTLALPRLQAGVTSLWPSKEEPQAHLYRSTRQVEDQILTSIMLTVTHLASTLRPKGFRTWRKCRSWAKTQDLELTSTQQMIGPQLPRQLCQRRTSLWTQSRLLLRQLSLNWELPNSIQFNNTCSKMQQAEKILSTMDLKEAIIR